jgi:hypothetical protein
VSLLRVLIAALGLSLGVAVPALAGQDVQDSRHPPVAHFVHLPQGWHQNRATPDARALNWNYRPNPYGWASSMPRGGIAVNVYFPPPHKPHYRPLRLVLPRQPATLLEGTRDTPEYRIFGRVRGVDVNIFVDIRRLHPTCGDLRATQRVVSRIRFS